MSTEPDKIEEPKAKKKPEEPKGPVANVDELPRDQRGNALGEWQFATVPEATSWTSERASRPLSGAEAEHAIALGCTLAPATARKRGR